METSKGGGGAHFVIDYGPETALLWVVFMDADGACWTVPNPEVRMSFNWTMSAATQHRHKDKFLNPTTGRHDPFVHNPGGVAFGNASILQAGAPLPAPEGAN